MCSDFEVEVGVVSSFSQSMAFCSVSDLVHLSLVLVGEGALASIGPCEGALASVVQGYSVVLGNSVALGSSNAGPLVAA